MKTALAPLNMEESGSDWLQPLRSLEIAENEFAGASEHAHSLGPESALAGAVLRQAASDLRRFREAEDAIGRELYSEALGWFNSDDSTWPYSFLNVCQSLGVSPEDIRDEVFADARAGWLSHTRRVATATATHFAGSLALLFLSRRNRTLAVQHS